MDSPDKRYEVTVSEKAAEMLTQHILFVARVSESAAEKLREQIIKAIKSLDTLPRRCSWFTAEYIPRNKYRKLTVNKRYLILYQIRDDDVYVDYILDCRQDYQWLILDHE
jgi:plasmid stabilization system protein ParE